MVARARDVVAALVAATLSAGCVASYGMTAAGAGVPTGSADTGVACAARHAGDGAAVRWLVPEREPDRRALAAWCAAVGPVEVDSAPVRATRSSGERWKGDSLVVATWNVHVGGGDLLAFLRNELAWNCGDSGVAGGGPDFVLLVQEAHRASAELPDPPEGSHVAGPVVAAPPDGPRRDIVQVAERCGLSLFYVPSMRNGREPVEGDSAEDGVERLKPEDRGNAVLSTLPLSDLAAIELPFEAQRRVAAVASVPAPRGTSLRVVSVHYDVAGNILRVLGSGGSMRVRQNDGLTEALDRLDPERSMPVVVAGDINTWSYRETVVLRMRETYSDSPDPGREKTRGAWPPDHLFFRASEADLELVEGSYRVVEREHGSDHRARVAVLRLRR